MMVSIVERKLPEIRRLCEKHGVSQLYLFGSAAREGDFNNHSAVDLIADFHISIAACADELERLRVYFANKDQLQSKLQDLFQRQVDLLTQDTIRDNKFLKSHINSEKILLYAAA